MHGAVGVVQEAHRCLAVVGRDERRVDRVEALAAPLPLFIVLFFFSDTLIGWLVLRETVGPRRIALMALIAAGAVIVEIGG